MIFVSKFRNIIYYLFLVTVILFCLSCENHIIQRAAADYFLYKEGNWWRYLSVDSDTAFVEVEAVDSVLQTECYPVDFDGELHYILHLPGSIKEYYKFTCNFSGIDYTIIESFVTRIELPLVIGNSWQDSLIDSLNVAGQWLKAEYRINGKVQDFSYEEAFDGDVYEIELYITEKFTSSDTTTTTETHLCEFYAPDIGLVRFYREGVEYVLLEYQLQ